MNRQRIFGILGIAGAGVCVILLAIAVILFEHGVYSPLSCFVSELGIYIGGYFTLSSALIYNIGTVLGGLAIAGFMVFYGIHKDVWTDAIVGFFGMLSGVLLCAQGVYTLNYAQYHSPLLIALFASIFVMCALYIIFQLTGKTIKDASFSVIIVAFLAGCASAGFAVFILTGGMARVFAEDAAGAGRLSVMPFAIIEWAALLLLLAFIVLLAVRMLQGKEKSNKTGIEPHNAMR